MFPVSKFVDAVREPEKVWFFVGGDDDFLRVDVGFGFGFFTSVDVYELERFGVENWG